MKLALNFNRDWPAEGTHVIVLGTDGTLEAATVCSAYRGGFIRGHVKPIAGVYYGPVLCHARFEARAWAVVDRAKIEGILY